VRTSHPAEVVPERGTPTTSAGPGVPEGLVTEVLELLFEHAERTEPVTVDRLAARLPVPAAQIEQVLGRLADRADLEVAEDGVRLTAGGFARATAAVRRHRLTERFLLEVIGLEWWKVHHEAERWEAALTDETEARLLELLGDPGTCPHGNPIPGSSKRPHHPDAVPLAEAPLGPVHVVRITEMLEADDEALQLLQSCGFVPGRDAEVKAHEDGWVEVAGTVHDAALPPHVATHTYVAPR
jgi:DtxR family transcriptional regulator, Mn-dependent transcriptional regulator